MILVSTAIAACGSGSPSNSSSSGSSGSNSSQTQLQQEAVNFARCMRSHGVSNFPDPSPNGGGLNVNIPGINPSSPAFKGAQTACKQLLPVKRAPSGPPSEPPIYGCSIGRGACARMGSLAFPTRGQTRLHRSPTSTAR